MRILFITGSYPPVKCGVGDYVSILSSMLAKHEHCRLAVLTGRESATGDIGSGVTVFPAMACWRFKEFVEIFRIVRQWRPDVIHIQYPTKGYGKSKMPLFLPFLLSKLPVKIIQTWHEPLGFWRRLRYLPCALTRDHLIVVEPDYYKFLPDWYAWLLRQKRIFRYIPVGTNIPAVRLDRSEQAEIRATLGIHGKRMVAYFGFAIPSKRVEDIFDISDPDNDRIVLICDLHSADSYHQKLLGLVNNETWRGKVFVTGFLKSEEVARLLAASDVGIFPFATGVTSRNASVLAARSQGAFVLTTSYNKHGYSADEHTYYAEPGNIKEMRQAVADYAGKSRSSAMNLPPDWDFIVAEHIRLYHDVLKN